MTMKRINIEMILDRSVDLGAIVDMLDKGLNEYTFHTSVWCGETHKEVYRSFKLKPIVVVDTPFNENHVSLVMKREDV